MQNGGEKKEKIELEGEVGKLGGSSCLSYNRLNKVEFKTSQYSTLPLKCGGPTYVGLPTIIRLWVLGYFHLCMEEKRNRLSVLFI